MASILDYSTTAASNTSVGGVNVAEGMQAGLVNNAMRAMMADTRKWQLDWSGIVTGGTGNAYTITTNQGIAAYADGMRFTFRADRNNTGAATLNVDGRGAKSIRKVTGVGEQLAANDIVNKAVYDVVYDLASDIMVIVGFGLPTISTFAKTLLDDADAATMRTTLGLAIGTNVQAYDAELAQIAALADPNADRILFWDDSASSYAFLTLGTGLSITGTTLNGAVSGAVAAQNVSSGTSVDFTVPSTATRIVIQFDAVSLSGTDNILVQLGDSGGIETTGYVSGSRETASSSTSGMVIFVNSATRACTGEMSLSRVGSSNRWISSHAVYTPTVCSAGAGSKTLSDAITTIRITSTGSDTFDGAGVVSILYWS